MKNCLELEKLLQILIGDQVVGFFERKLATANEDVRVFTPVYAKKSQLKSCVN